MLNSTSKGIRVDTNTVSFRIDIDVQVQVPIRIDHPSALKERWGWEKKKQSSPYGGGSNIHCLMDVCLSSNEIAPSPIQVKSCI